MREKPHNMERMVEQAPDQEKLFYVPDAHNNELIYLEEPCFSVPAKQGKRGATHTKIKADKPSVRIDKYCNDLAENQWDNVEVTKTANGLKYIWCLVPSVYDSGGDPIFEAQS